MSIISADVFTLINVLANLAIKFPEIQKTMRSLMKADPELLKELVATIEADYKEHADQLDGLLK